MLDPVIHSQFEYYLAHQLEFVEKYNGKVIVMVNHKVVGAYDTYGEAYRNAAKQYELGTFLLQLCTPGPDAYTIKTHQRFLLPD
jgi:hypothetical protein